jgi:sporulation protein YlmC with PRC-barrel domain
MSAPVSPKHNSTRKERQDMKRLAIAVSGVACALFVASAWAQQDNQDQYKSTTSPKAKDVFGKDQDSTLSPTGRTGQSMRASKLTGAEVKDSQGQSVGRIEDVVVNPSSGRIEFAVLSLSSGTAASTTSPSTTTPATTTTTASTAGKLVPVPWMLLRPGSVGSVSTTTPTTRTPGTEQQYAFSLNVDRSKLEQAPSFDRNNWPDISQGEWHQRIFSHYGRGPSATGGAESPSGTSIRSEGKDKEDKSSTPDSPSRPEKPQNR